ncbi:MAG TPA: bifunctional DNA-formamidopyrimidine glycosylase/DNA-(apurinic or apyrimidinic site) lyase [Gammaproteobacteria bacterium]|nr:bifunctional DNA-formamidopyrimidine glycosylase/DNA-(apurinic or apyrimidinic site) lyase [Gammaproteobacteria bacterium]
MPELPEVETTCRGIAPHIIGNRVSDIIIRQKQLRWPISPGLKQGLINQAIQNVSRRGKYILLHANTGTAIIHLGMSGSLRITDRDSLVRKHDHVDIIFSNEKILRLHDPRRFGALLWTTDDPFEHELLQELGPEPLTDDFSATALHQLSRRRKTSIKTFIMNSHVVVGVGNIYASEALFLAGIHPSRRADKISLPRYELLVAAIKKVLAASIKQGGTTLRDFVNEKGQPGYFQQTLNVYGRTGEACRQCGKLISQTRTLQRSTFYCSHCQK